MRCLIHSLLFIFHSSSEKSPLMAPISLTNGTHNDMPLTEYSANPISEKTAASSSVPEAFLLPDGHPDVSEGVWRARALLNRHQSISA